MTKEEFKKLFPAICEREVYPCGHNKWIKLSESLPSNDRYVNIAIELKHGKKTTFGYYSAREGWKILEQHFTDCFYQITHWKDLSIPPLD